MDSKLIAPCGMNCNICYAHLRDKDVCSGCAGNADSLFKYCAKCFIRNCEYLKSSGDKFCFSCPDFPCKRLKQLDKRYRTKYHMSMIENLAAIKDKGIEAFMRREKMKWKCACGALVSCHWRECRVCGKTLT